MAHAATLYHYCSNSAFHSIVGQKRVRLSLLSSSNDSKEGSHILDVANKILPDDFAEKKEAIAQLERVISAVSAIGFCLSADGDVLSQWRAYADNAQGVAIGFDREAINVAAEAEADREIVVRVAPVAYDVEFLTEIMLPDLQPVIEHYSSGKMQRPRLGTLVSPLTEEERAAENLRYREAIRELFLMLMRIANYAYMIKSPFFSEEKEWRILVHLTNLDGVLALPGAKFESAPEKLKPFREFPLEGFSPLVVREVVLGPRNQTPNEVVRLYLSTHGLGHVTVRRSSGSYR